MDTKKYIIELKREETAYKTVDLDGTPLIQLLALLPYTEPDTEKVRKEAYDKGKNDAYSTPVLKEEVDEAYQRGLNDAWNAVRKIESLSSHEFDEIFTGYDDYSKVFENYTPQEAIDKIRQYEQKDFKVGDEVISDEGIKGVTVDMDDYLLHVLDENGVIQAWPREDSVKTGRHFPEIAEVLRKMQEEKE